MNVIVVGATSGIGKAIAETYVNLGHKVGITGRRANLLKEIQETNPEAYYVQTMDIANVEETLLQMQELIKKMGQVELIILNSGVGFPKATLEQEIQTVEVNVKGFTALARYSYDYFRSTGRGHLVGVSSVAAVRSSPMAPEYHASKAYMSSYMEGLRMRSLKYKNDISITDIRPGFVETEMTEANKNMFWVATPRKAAFFIQRAIRNKKKVAYITPRYWLVAFAFKMLPSWLLAKMI